MSKAPGSMASSIVSISLMVLLAAWAINAAAHLILAVLPVLIGVAATVGVGVAGVALWRGRDSW